MTFADRVIRFSHQLRADWAIPPPYQILFPYDGVETMQVLETFYQKYYADSRPRIGLFGINPGRFGAGVTGVPFTDPVRLAEVCGITNTFAPRPELSSVFVYDFIEAYGGAESFYQDFYITSLSPLGFTKDGKNFNYYDSRDLQAAVEPYIIDHLRQQLSFGLSPRVAICIGRGKNLAYFEKLNQKRHFFEEILPVPHPRWVMQYRRKQAGHFVQEYLDALARARELANTA